MNTVSSNQRVSNDVRAVPKETYRQAHNFPRAKPVARGEDFAEESFIRGTLLSKILTVCGRFLLSNCSFVAVWYISSMLNNFCHE